MLNKFYKTIHNKYSRFFKFIFFIRYLFAIFLISTAVFLTIPNFFNYEKKAELIKNHLFDSYKFKIIKLEKIKFSAFPIPNLELSNVKINVKNTEISLDIKELIIFPRIYINVFVRVKIIVKRDPITGNKLNHNCEVDIFESIGRKFVLFLILIWSQNIDNG